VCVLNLTGDLADLGEAINITAYRLVQECLTNVLRHADATRAEIEIRRDGGVLYLSVADDGKGLGEGNESETARFGLMGIRERVQALHGEFRLESRPGEGLRVSAAIPIRSSARGETDSPELEVRAVSK
jgi:signal transduction histidine kinase